jgi:hypothetical protein
MSIDLRKKVPAIILMAKKELISNSLYDHAEKYNHKTETLIEGKYWLGSDTKKTRCKEFTILGHDKSRQDDTKDK